MHRLIARLLILLAVVLSTMAATDQNADAFWHGTPAPLFGVLAPSASWTTDCAISGSCQPTASTFQVPTNTSLDTDGTTVDITVAGSTAGFPSGCAINNTCVCHAFGFYGNDEVNGQHACTVLNTNTIHFPKVLFVSGHSWQCGGSCPVPTGTNIYVALVQGAMPISNVTTNSSGGCRITVATTAHLATNDHYTISEVSGSGAIGPNGNWPIKLVSGGTTQFDLGTTAEPGPSCSGFTYTGNGNVGYDEQPTAGFDEYPKKVIEAQNTEYITIGAAMSNRQWIKNVTCYYEDSGPVIVTQQSANPKTGSGGWVVQLNASLHDGDAVLTCDINPVNGIVRRMQMWTWLNISGLTGFVNRNVSGGSTPSTLYVDASTGILPVSGAAQATSISTDSTGKIVSFWTGTCPGVGCTQTTAPASLTNAKIVGAINGSGVVPANGWSQPDFTASGQTSGCGGLTNCILFRSIGANLPTNTTWTETPGCGTTPGQTGSPGSSTVPYAVINWATNCMSTLTNGNGGTICVNNSYGTTVPYLEPVSGTAIGGTTYQNSRKIQVIPCGSSAVPAVTITAMSWSSANGGTATYTTTTNSFDGTKGIMITASEPIEFNYYCPVPTIIDTTHFACSLNTVGNTSLTAYLLVNPYLVHPGMTTFFGHAVIPIYMTEQGGGTDILFTKNLDFRDVLLDGDSVIGIQTQNGGSNFMPYDQDVDFQEGAWWSLIGPLGAPYGRFSSSGAQSQLITPFNQSNARSTSFAEMSIQINGGIPGLRLGRNMGGTMTWSGISIGATSVGTNIGNTNNALFNVQLFMPINSSGLFLGFPERETADPRDNTTTSLLPQICDHTVAGCADPSYDGTSKTTVYVTSSQAPSTFVSATSAIFEGGNCQTLTSTTTTLYGNPNLSLNSGFNVVGPFTYDGTNHVMHFQLWGNWTAGGLCGAGGLANGDPTWIITDAHPDYFQSILVAGTQQNYPTIDYNLYMQRYFSKSENYILVQGGATRQNSLTLTSASGTSSSLSVYSNPGTQNGAYMIQFGSTNAPGATSNSGCIPYGTQVGSFASTSISMTASTTCNITTGIGNIGVGNLVCTLTQCQDLYIAATGTTQGINLVPGDFINVTTQGSPQDGEWRRVVSTSNYNTTGNFTIEEQFFPDIGTSHPVVYLQNKATKNIALVASRLGGITTAPNQHDQYQNPSDNWSIIQFTHNVGWEFFRNQNSNNGYGFGSTAITASISSGALSITAGGSASTQFIGFSLFDTAGNIPLGTTIVSGTYPNFTTNNASLNVGSESMTAFQAENSQGQGFGLWDFALLDSLITGLTNSCSPPSPTGCAGASMSAQPPFWTGTISSSGTNVMNGYNIDGDDFGLATYAGSTFTPGTNTGTQSPTVSDLNYTPTGLTWSMIGEIGGVDPNGTPLFHWNADMVLIHSGHVVGAMP